MSALAEDANGAASAVPAALFTRRPDGFYVRVWSAEDLTGEVISVPRKRGGPTRVRLTKLIYAATAERPEALWAFHQRGAAS